jgi:hypothetical protein
MGNSRPVSSIHALQQRMQQNNDLMNSVQGSLMEALSLSKHFTSNSIHQDRTRSNTGSTAQDSRICETHHDVGIKVQGEGGEWISTPIGNSATPLSSSPTEGYAPCSPPETPVMLVYPIERSSNGSMLSSEHVHHHQLPGATQSGAASDFMAVFACADGNAASLESSSAAVTDDTEALPDASPAATALECGLLLADSIEPPQKGYYADTIARGHEGTGLGGTGGEKVSIEVVAVAQRGRVVCAPHGQLQVQEGDQRRLELARFVIHIGLKSPHVLQGTERAQGDSMASDTLQMANVVLGPDTFLLLENPEHIISCRQEEATADTATTTLIATQQALKCEQQTCTTALADQQTILSHTCSCRSLSNWELTSTPHDAAHVVCASVPGGVWGVALSSSENATQVAAGDNKSTDGMPMLTYAPESQPIVTSTGPFPLSHMATSSLGTTPVVVCAPESAAPCNVTAVSSSSHIAQDNISIGESSAMVASSGAGTASAAEEMGLVMAQLEAATEARKAAQQAREDDARRQIATYAMRAVAAGRVQRGWRCWRRSTACTARAAAAVRVQKGIRAWLGRKRVAHQARVSAARSRVRVSSLSLVVSIATLWLGARSGCSISKQEHSWTCCLSLPPQHLPPNFFLYIGLHCGAND